MDESKQARIRWLFNGAMDLPAPERIRFLERECGHDDDLKRRMLTMLAATNEPMDAARRSDDRGDSTNTHGEFAELREGPGSRIGPYELLEQIGEGGFGVVFAARQEHPVSRIVALKIIKLGMDTRQVVARFEQERQALAMMDHPNIARVLDAGDTTSGRPYFVMDLVRGDPIVEYCDRHDLAIEARLDLFVQVCGAIQHAHAKGIIHRDIKPSNVLVGSDEGKPVAKVIDFGIAKATERKLTDKTLVTEQQQVMGTFQYMSPEQAEGSPDIDTRTDVYSLGVLLYELLTGSTPFDRRVLQQALYSEIHRLIREQEPPRPSTRVSEAGEKLAHIAARRRVEPKKLGALMRGELDWIVMKALEKDRQRRYETAAGLARDVRRYLNGEDVAAAPPSAVYRLSKFARRNRGLVLAIGAVGVALSIGLVGFAWAARAAQRERDLARSAQFAADLQRANAERNEQKADAINQFLLDMLGATDIRRLGREATIEQALDSAAVKVETSWADRPEVEASVRRILGASYSSLGSLDAAEPHLRKALAMRRELHGEESREHAQSLQDFGGWLKLRGRTEEALTAFEQAADIALKAAGPDSNLALTAQSDYANTLVQLGRLDEAEERLRENLASRERVSGRESNSALVAINSLAVLMHNRGRLDEAELLYREAAEVGERVLGAEHADTITARMNLASLLHSRGQFEQAEPLMKESLAGIRRVFGESHPRTAVAARQLGDVYLKRGRLRDALPLFEEAVAIGTRAEGETSLGVAGYKQSLALVLKDLRELPRAIAVQREIFAIYEGALGPENEKTLVSRLNLADMLVSARELEEARVQFEDLLVAVPRCVGDEHALVVRVNNGYALLLAFLDREAESGPFLRRALEVSRIVHGPQDAQTLITEFNLTANDRLNRRFEAAEQGSRELVPKFESCFGARHPHLAIVRSGHGKTLEALGRLEEAREQFVRAVDIAKEAFGASNPAYCEHALSVGRVLVGLGRANEAEPTLSEVVDVYRSAHGDNDWRTAEASIEWGRCEQSLGRFSAAEQRLLFGHEVLANIEPPRLKSLERARQSLAEFYAAWNSAEPTPERAAHAAEWAATMASDHR